MLPLPIVIALITAFLITGFASESSWSSETLLIDSGLIGSGSQQSEQIESRIDLEQWGIYNGCISSNRIRVIKVLDANSAMLTLVDGKQVKMRFMNRCQGIKQHGFVYTARNNLFCTHNYSVRVLHTGTHCQVESLEPVVGKD